MLPLSFFFLQFLFASLLAIPELTPKSMQRQSEHPRHHKQIVHIGLVYQALF